VRAFLGVPLPEELRERLAKRAGRVEGLRAQKAGTIHLTIRFLGEIADPAPILEALEPVAAAHAPFDLVLKGLGAFPRPTRANVVWVGLDRGDLPAGALAKGVEMALEPLGFAPDRRPFHAHVTLGRFKNPRRLAMEEGDQLSFGSARADRLILYSSILTPQGAIHHPVRELSLGGGK